MVFESALVKAAARLLPGAAESLLPGAGKATIAGTERGGLKAGETAATGNGSLLDEAVEAMLNPQSSAMMNRITGKATDRVAGVQLAEIGGGSRMYEELAGRAYTPGAPWLSGNSDAMVSKMWLERFYMDPAKRMPLTAQFMDKTAQRQFVQQGEFAVAPSTVALETGGLDTCGALVVQDTAKGMHYLAHADIYHEPAALIASLKGLDLKAANLYFMPGKIPSVTPQNLVRGLMREPQALSNIKFLDWPTPTSRFTSVLSHDGKLFLP